MNQDALKLALEFLEDNQDLIEVYERPEYLSMYKAAINKCKEALAQPEQEPLAYVNVEKRRLEFAEPMVWHTPTVVNLERIPLYTQQRTWVGLTKDDIESWKLPDTPTVAEFAWFVEAKLRDKNWAG